MLNKKQLFTKRLFDLTISILLIPIVFIPIVVLIIFSTFSTGNLGLFRQTRIGLNGKRFLLYKIRSLKGIRHFDSVDIKNSETFFGSWLRRTKLDELPQIFNVLNGTMSWVGPRPDIPGYADRLKGDDRIILKIRPGITGPATLKYSNEDQILLLQEDPLKYNDEVIWPDKVRINIEYIKNWSFWKDVGYLFASVVGVKNKGEKGEVKSEK